MLSRLLCRRTSCLDLFLASMDLSLSASFCCSAVASRSGFTSATPLRSLIYELWSRPCCSRGIGFRLANSGRASSTWSVNSFSSWTGARTAAAFARNLPSACCSSRSICSSEIVPVSMTSSDMLRLRERCCCVSELFFPRRAGLEIRWIPGPGHVRFRLGHYGESYTPTAPVTQLMTPPSASASDTPCS